MGGLYKLPQRKVICSWLWIENLSKMQALALIPIENDLGRVQEGVNWTFKKISQAFGKN